MAIFLEEYCIRIVNEALDFMYLYYKSFIQLESITAQLYTS